MKHPSNREFYTYWNDKRGAARAPDRSEIEPGAVRGLLGDIFVLSYDATDGYPFRVAGTRVCALLGCDLKDRGFSTLFAPDSRRQIEDIITVVAEETLAAVAGITATAQDGSPAHLELLLLPFNPRAHVPMSSNRIAGAVRQRTRPVARFQADVVALSRPPAAASRSPRLEETRGRARLHGL